jgi:trans-aconitate methyltransferase
MDLRESRLSQDVATARHPWESARKTVVTDLLKKHTSSNECMTVLDIGCGDTWLIEQLSAEFKNFKFIAVDTAFDEDMLEEYRERLKGKPIEVFDSLESAFASSNHKIDIILLLDVIEHIENDISFLKWVLSFTNNIDSKTKFFITVPAFQNLFCSHDEFLGHYRRYTNKMLKEHVNKADLQIEKIGYFFTLLLPPRVLNVLLEKIRKPQKSAKGVGGWKKTPLDNFISSLLVADYKMSCLLRSAGFKLPGLSNYVVCKRSV